MVLDFYSDLSVSSITVIVKKKEDLSFCFNCPSRNFDGFIFVMGGSGLFENEDLSEVLTKNSLVLLQKGDKYSVRALDDDFEYIATGYTVEPYGALKSIGLPTVQNLPKTSNVISLIGNMLNVWESRVPLFDLRTKIILEQMLVELFDMHQKTALFSQQNVLAPALEYISRHYDESISAKELADLCRLSVSHFRRLFTRRIGKTPMQYREDIRIDCAKKMLQSGMLTVCEIATRLGYFDVYHFSKAFKKHTGKSPKTYAKGEKQ